jgi:hypothetical protein
MATVLDSVRRAVHDTSAALIDNNIPAKISDLVTSTTNSGFTIVRDLLAIVRDLTEDAEDSEPVVETGSAARARRSRSHGRRGS